MAYVSSWERLSDAVTRVATSAHLSPEEAQADICRAIADGVINIRGKLGRHFSKGFHGGGIALEGKDFQLPANMVPKDFDWERSRPLGPCVVRREASRLPGLWNLELLELSKADVTQALCVVVKEGDDGRPAKVATSTTRTRPAKERAQTVVEELYPRGVPDQATVPNAILCRQIGDKLKEKKLTPVSDETILRAAGRRRK